MIYWMSDEVNKVWDEKCPWLTGIVCEIPDEELKGHIVLHLELDDDKWYQLDLGVCDGLPDEAINEKFVRKFGDFIEEYRNSDEWCGPVLENLEEVRDAFLKTLEEK